ncbi:Vng1268h [Halorubrum sp. DM2]|nr:Vng1268h [Halorubrum sp. DM2]
MGVGGPISALTAEPPPDSTLAVQSAGSGVDAADEEAASGGVNAGTDGPRSAVAAGTYDPAAAASNAVDTVVTGRLDPAVLTATGLPSGIGGRVRQLLDRYESASLDDVRQATGGAALTGEGPEGCAVAVGDVDAAALAAELDADPDVVREAEDDSGFARFRARSIGSAVAVASGEIVGAYGPTPDAAAAHRDAGIDAERERRAGTSASYGPLPSLLGGDATVCVDLGPDARDHLRDLLADAPEGLRTAVDASSAVGASLRLTDEESGSGSGGAAADGDTDDPSVALRYGAVADPRRLDRETAEAIARAAREGETSLADATVTRHGRTVIVDAAAGSDLFASHASLFGGAVGDPIEVADA